MLVRDRFEKEYRDIFERNGYGTTVWGPMAAGLLSGKYNSGSIPDKTRFADDYFAKTFVLPKYFGSEEITAKTVKMLTGLADIAKELDCTQA